MSDEKPELSVSAQAPRNRGGRPRIEEPRSSVSTWLPAHAHDRLIQIARERDTSVSAVVRSLLIIRTR